MAASSTLQNVTLDSGSLLQLTNTGNVNLVGSLTNNGVFGQGLSGSPRVIIDGSVTVTGTGVWDMTPTFIIAATNGSTLINEVSHTIRGSGVIGEFAGLNLVNKGLIDADHPMGLTILSRSSSTTTNMGIVRASNGGTLSFSAAYLINNGTLEALGGNSISSITMSGSTLANVSAGTLTGGSYRSIDNGSGATMSLAGSSVTTIAANTTVELSGANATMKFQGTNLYASLTANAGTLKLHNDHQFNMSNGYTQTATGALEFELASLTSVATLTSSGTATLGGTLSVLLGGGFTPAPSDVFTIVDASSLSGTFANVANGQRLDTLGADGSFLVTYNGGAGTVILSDFAAVDLPGDYNFDGKVDSADYVVWRKNGLGPAAHNTWQTNFGTSAMSGSDAAATNSAATSIEPMFPAVPEPASMLMILSAACWVSLARRSGLRTQPHKKILMRTGA
jgi:hypothetical protein